jgi:hypothetical protein
LDNCQFETVINANFPSVKYRHGSREQDHQAMRHHEGESSVAATPGGLMGPERVLTRLLIFQLSVQRMDFAL